MPTFGGGRSLAIVTALALTLSAVAAILAGIICLLPHVGF